MRAIKLALLCIVLATCTTLHDRPIYVCDACGEGYYGYEDAQMCHNTTVSIIYE
jgi:hypothetical protein